MFAKASAASLLLAACSAATVTSAPASRNAASFADWQRACAAAGDGREAWTAPAPPFHVHGRTWYVGTCGIAALLVETDDGEVLLDSGMPEAAPLIVANIERLGFALPSVKALLSSHEHLDHVGATAEIKRRTGAIAVGLRRALPPLESGTPLPEDPQAGSIPPFDGFKIDRTVEDRGTYVQGGTVFTAYSTPTHTPGSTSWTWQSCEGGACRTITYADSLTTPATEGYRFRDHPDHIAEARQGFRNLAAMPCDILLTPHPGVSGMVERFSAPAIPDGRDACKAYSATAAGRFEELLKREEQ